MKDLCTYTITNKELYDYNTLIEITGLNKAKLHRTIHKAKINYTSYLNRHLFSEEDVMKIMEIILLERLMKIWNNKNQPGHTQKINADKEI